MKSDKKFLNKNLVVIIILSAVVIIPITTCVKAEHHKLSQFISPDICGDCHTAIFDQWENSMHSLAHVDPLYVKVSHFLRQGLTDKGEIKEAESCVKCHTPVGFVSGYPRKVSDDREKTAPIARRGIQCDYCHSATGAKKMYNNGLTLKPGNGEENPGVKRGPFKDSKSDFHDSAYSEFHTKAEICGTCHDVRHVEFGTKLETTYEEWKNGPYNSKDPAKRINCQGCHMYQRPGVPATGSTDRPKNPGLASDDGPEREHVFTHYFVGGNSFVPGQFKDKLKPKMAIARLQNAAELSIDEKKIAKGKIIVNVKNTGAGHYLPTGLTDTRQMWLDITIKDKKGKTVLALGQLDAKGYISKNTILYNTVFGDGKGNPVLSVVQAREILKDKRIPPLKSVHEAITLPEGKWKQLTVEVKLLYRIAPQKVVDLVLGEGKMKLPVVTMTTIKKKIKI
ncbi:MAG: cytochrome c554 family protein [bacterium]|nr:cytochrome c554 family protein [bacterium]